MDDWQLSDQERELEAALRSESDADRPEFSESLHTRIMGAIHREHAATAGSVVEMPPVEPSHRTPGALLVAAASIAILVAAVAWLVKTPRPGDVGPATGQQANVAEDNLAVEDESQVLDSVWMAADLLLAPVEESTEGAELEEPTQLDTVDKLAKVDPSAQWDDIAHDVEILANVLFVPFDASETETP